MQLISVNTSLPVEVEYEGKTISTSIFKKAVFEPVAVSEQGLAGDQQVDLENHGGGHKAVYAFSVKHYDYWLEQLGLDELLLGHFGENLTLTDLDESQLCIGDQLKINNCILEITQPRVPCFKLGMVFNDNSFPKKFIEHGATGIYFKVLQSGTIQVSDTAKLHYQHPERLSVQTLFKAYFDKDFIEPLAVMKRAAKIAELSDEWRRKVLSKLNKS